MTAMSRGGKINFFCLAAIAFLAQLGSAEPLKEINNHDSMEKTQGSAAEVSNFLDESYSDTSLDDVSDDDEDLVDSEAASLDRTKRSLNIPGYDPYVELLTFRDGHYLTREEEALAKADHYLKEVVAMRMVTPAFDDLDELEMRRETADGTPTGARMEAENRTMKALMEAAQMKPKNGGKTMEETVSEMFVTDIIPVSGLDAKNRTQYRVSVLLFCKGTGKETTDSIVRTSDGDEYYLGDNFTISRSLSDFVAEAYTPVDEKTVFQATLRLSSLPYMPQYEDLNNTATLKVTNSLTLLTRPMFRYCFGEFFFRSVVMNYWSGPLLGDTIVHMAFLLEASEYNVVDVDTVWKRQAATGILGEYPIDKESFVIYEVEYVPSNFKQFLVAEVTRQGRVLDTVEFLTLVGVPSFFGMLIFFFVINICAWEGFFCKLCFENEAVCCCKKGDEDEEAAAANVKYDKMGNETWK